MKRTSPYQISILERLAAGNAGKLIRVDGRWYWEGDTGGKGLADGYACAGMIRKIPPWLASQPNGRFQMTDAGRLALAAAKEKTPARPALDPRREG